ncbi:MAG: hypothetical protein HFI29_01575 [Lachnospiraceae bacterium]|jgi:hypothetical protein|nr:hypothetical protein [Lachnospiraceae bacterium]
MQEAVRVLEEIKLANFPEKWYTLRMICVYADTVAWREARIRGGEEEFPEGAFGNKR